MMNVLARWVVLGSVMPLAGCLSVASQVGVGLMTAAEQQVYNGVTDQKQQKELAWRQAMSKARCSDLQSAYGDERRQTRRTDDRPSDPSSHWSRTQPRPAAAQRPHVY